MKITFSHTLCDMSIHFHGPAENQVRPGKSNNNFSMKLGGSLASVLRGKNKQNKTSSEKKEILGDR